MTESKILSTISKHSDIVSPMSQEFSAIIHTINTRDDVTPVLGKVKVFLEEWMAKEPRFTALQCVPVGPPMFDGKLPHLLYQLFVLVVQIADEKPFVMVQYKSLKYESEFNKSDLANIGIAARPSSIEILSPRQVNLTFPTSAACELWLSQNGDKGDIMT